jgi:hypothetical protein
LEKDCPDGQSSRRQHLLLRKDAVKREIVHSRTSHLSADADALAEISLI